MNVTTLGSDWLDATARSLCVGAGLTPPVGREPIRVWERSGVQRLHLSDGRTAVLKYAAKPFTDEAITLQRVAAAGVPAPAIYAHTLRDNILVMIMEDLGDPTREATDNDGAIAAARLHRSGCDLPGLAWDESRLARLPGATIDLLQHCHRAGRLLQTTPLIGPLASLARRARQRAAAAETPPFGTVHGELHPTSVHIGTRGWRLLDYGMTFTGPAILDLATWQGTRHPADPDRMEAQLHHYVSAGGEPQILRPRGSLPPTVWALGWHRLWSAAWLLQRTPITANPHDHVTTAAILRRQIHSAAALL